MLLLRNTDITLTFKPLNELGRLASAPPGPATAGSAPPPAPGLFAVGDLCRVKFGPEGEWRDDGRVTAVNPDGTFHVKLQGDPFVTLTYKEPNELGTAPAAHDPTAADQARAAATAALQTAQQGTPTVSALKPALTAARAAGVAAAAITAAEGTLRTAAARELQAAQQGTSVAGLEAAIAAAREAGVAAGDITAAERIQAALTALQTAQQGTPTVAALKPALTAARGARVAAAAITAAEGTLRTAAARELQAAQQGTSVAGLEAAIAAAREAGVAAATITTADQALQVAQRALAAAQRPMWQGTQYSADYARTLPFATREELFAAVRDVIRHADLGIDPTQLREKADTLVMCTSAKVRP